MISKASNVGRALALTATLFLVPLLGSQASLEAAILDGGEQPSGVLPAGRSVFVLADGPVNLYFTGGDSAIAETISTSGGSFT